MIKVGCIYEYSVAYTDAEVQFTCTTPTLPTPLHLQPDLVIQIRKKLTSRSANGLPRWGWMAHLLQIIDQSQPGRGGVLEEHRSDEFSCYSWGAARSVLHVVH